MKTLTYNSANLSVKERLTVSSLLSLFESRLNAKWVAVTHQRPSHILLVDADQPEDSQRPEAALAAEVLLPVTANDRWPKTPFVVRPIHAYGPNGLVVLFNAIGQSLQGTPEKEAIRPKVVEAKVEPARVRMTGRLEVPQTTVRTVRPAAPSPPTRTVATAPIPAPRQSAADPIPDVQAPARAFVRWGPPRPVLLPPLFHMPNPRVHYFERAAPGREFLDLPAASLSPQIPAPPPAPISEPEARARTWAAPQPEARPALFSMPVSHRPTQLHRPAAPLIGRSRIEQPAPAPVKRVVHEGAPEIPVLRSSPPQWKGLEPEPEPVAELIDFRLPTEPVSEPAVFEAATEGALEPAQIPPVFEAPVESEAAFEPALSETNLFTEAEAEVPAEFAPEEIEPEFPVMSEALENLSEAIAVEALADDFTDEDAAADWWGNVQFDLDASGSAPAQSPESSPLGVLKAIKASNQPSIVEITGLPAVCIIPQRNIYFTTAPAARLETAMGAGAGIAWRTCSSEAEARQISGTEQSRQASLEQLCWAASLLTPPSDFDSVAGRVVRLRRWPPLTESRGRSKFVRYATLLSGAQATAREIAEITGDPLEDIVVFVHACEEMNLLDTSTEPGAPMAMVPVQTHGAGILRGMIDQLTPPKL